MKLLIAGLAAAAMFGTAAMAAQPAAGPSLSGADCILANEIRNHTIVDQDTILMRVNHKGVYRIDTAQACFRSAISSDPISFDTRGREKICKASQLGLQARSGWCGAQSIVRLSQEEVDALPKKLKP
jgi:hypothetical protein